MARWLFGSYMVVGYVGALTVVTFHIPMVSEAVYAAYLISVPLWAHHLPDTVKT